MILASPIPRRSVSPAGRAAGGFFRGSAHPEILEGIDEPCCFSSATGNATGKFNQVDSSFGMRLRALVRKRKRRNRRDGSLGPSRLSSPLTSQAARNYPILAKYGCRALNEAVFGNPHVRFERGSCSQPSQDGRRLDLPMTAKTRPALSRT